MNIIATVKKFFIKIYHNILHNIFNNNLINNQAIKQDQLIIHANLFKRNKLGNKWLKIIPRNAHHISRKNISKYVLKVLYTLKEHGYQSYLVGGGVRDLLLKFHPKDFDVVTNAYPEKIKKIFKNGYIIGKRFQLVHVCFASNIVEVATFRAQHCGKYSKEGMILRDNVYGNIEEDVMRRDFTINALYYNIVDYTILDYVGGIQDLNHKILRLIGTPEVRYREDPVRMLRAVRFAAKLGFKIAADTEQPLFSLGNLLLNVSSIRLYDEYVKLFFTGHPVASYQLLKYYKLLNILFPNFNELSALGSKNSQNMELFILQALKNIEAQKYHYKEFNPAYLIAVLLWHSLVAAVKIYIKHNDSFKHTMQIKNHSANPPKLIEQVSNNLSAPYTIDNKLNEMGLTSEVQLSDNLIAAEQDLHKERISEIVIYKKIAEQLLSKQNHIINLSKKNTVFIKDIWLFQIKLSKSAGKASKRADKLLYSAKFKPALEFLKLRALVVDKKAQRVVKWWLQYLDTKEQANLS